MHLVSPTLAFIDGLGGPEMVLVFIVVLLLFGGQKLPEFARGLGKTMREFKKAAAGVEDEFKRALDEDERKKNEAALASAAPAALPAGSTTPADTTPQPYHDPAHDSYHDHDYYSEAGPEVQTTPPDTTDTSSEETPKPNASAPAAPAAPATAAPASPASPPASEPKPAQESPKP